METAGLAAHKKNAARLGAHIAFVDESGYLLIPPVRRSWGPCGQTPIIHYSYKHDKISAISAVTVSPPRRRLGLYCQLHRKNIQQAEVCQFLRHLLRHLRGHVIVIWDNGEPHKGEPIREFCRRGPRVVVTSYSQSLLLLLEYGPPPVGDFPHAARRIVLE